MASFFRPSCAIYWIVWLLVLSFALGISVYEATYVITDNKAYNQTSTIMKGLCYFTAIFSFLGCIFVKCDISHLLCFILYTVPLIVIVPGLSIYGLVKNYSNTKNNATSFLNPDKLLTITQRHYDKTGSVPPWLIRAQANRDCCGIYSFKDYQLFFKTKNANESLPIECCASRGRDKSKKAPKPGTHCVTEKLGPLTESRSASGKSPDFYDYPWEEEIYIKKHKKDANEHPLLSKNSGSYKGIVHLQGCGKHIISQHIDALSALEAIFVVLIISSVLMVIVYVKNWCDGRHFSGGTSHHSLDVEDTTGNEGGAVEDPSTWDDADMQVIVAPNKESK